MLVCAGHCPPVADSRCSPCSWLCCRSCSSSASGWAGTPKTCPGSLRSAFVADHETRVVDEAINRIASDYYRPIRKSQLSNASITGSWRASATASLTTWSRANFASSPRPPSFTGIGVQVGPERRGLLIVRVFDSSPAARARPAGGGPDRRRQRAQLWKACRPTRRSRSIKGPPGTDVALGVEGSARRSPPGRRAP